MSRPFVFYTTRKGGFSADPVSCLPPSRLTKATPLSDVLSSTVTEKSVHGMALHSKLWGGFVSLRSILEDGPPQVEAKKPVAVGRPHDPLDAEPLPAVRRLCPVHREVLDSAEENGDNLLCPRGMRRGGRSGHWVSQWDLE